MLTGRVLITGGAGYLGRGIMHRAQREGWDVQFIVYSRDEQKHSAARCKYPNTRYVIGDILDTERLHLVASGCDYVIHAAAIKYIPECEAQPSEALRVNVDGTRSVMAAARAAGVKRVVCISTDKAASPLNTYGMTKALVERLVHESATLKGGTEFAAVRYGNVIGSTGSVWPVFKDQVQRHKRLSVTDPEMTRFFTPIDSAVELILAAFDAPPGTVVVPQPTALCLGDLADYLTGLWHLTPYVVVGVRPGEKSHEAMISFVEQERMAPYCGHDGVWLLHGPTARICGAAVICGMTSDTAQRMTPEMFVQHAQSSEAV